MKDIKDVLIEALNEGILDAEDMNAKIDGLESAALINSVLDKYYCSLADDCHYDGDTISFRFRNSELNDPNRCRLVNFRIMAEELDCKSFKIYPRIDIFRTPLLKDLHVETTGPLRIDLACKIENCELKCRRIILQDMERRNVNIKHTTIDAECLYICYFNNFNFQGSNFDKVENLVMRYCGSDINKIIERWNFCEIKNDKIIGPVQDGFDSSIDPLKDLGLDKYFKNLKELCIILPGERHDWGISLEKTSDKKSHDLLYKKIHENIQELDNGWTISLVNNTLRYKNLDR